MIMENFKNEYKYIMQKADGALILESKGYKSEPYSIYKSVIINIDNILARDMNLNAINDGIFKKRNNLKSLRNNVCDSIKRLENLDQTTNSLVIAEHLYSIKFDCQYTKISVDGTFDKPSYPGLLDIYKFPTLNSEKKGFVVVFDWVCSLIENVTPILVTAEGVLMFFDIDSDIKVAVTLPYNVTKQEFQNCISVLSNLGLTVVHLTQSNENVQIDSEYQTSQTTGEYIANGISKASETISKGVVIGASKLGELIGMGSNKICNHIQPGQTSVDPNIKTGLEYARTGTHTVIEIGGKAFGVLTQATKYIASKAAPHIVSSANNIIPKSWKERGKNNECSTVEQMVMVTGSSLQGLSDLFDSLHEGAIIFGRSAVRSGGQIMRHRYGEEAGQSTENALYSVGNLGMAALLVTHFTKKSVLTTAAKMTAIEIHEKYQKDNRRHEADQDENSEDSPPNNIKYK